MIKVEPRLLDYNQFIIRKILAKHPNAQFVMETELRKKNGWSLNTGLLFYTHIKDKEEYSNYFLYYTDGTSYYITDGLPYIGEIVGITNGSQYEYCINRHDIRCIDDVCIDGGRSYTKMNIGGNGENAIVKQVMLTIGEVNGVAGIFDLTSDNK